MIIHLDLHLIKKYIIQIVKRLYTAPEDLNSIQMDAFDSIDQLEKHRKNISYNMSNEDKHKYDNFIELNRLKELQDKKK